MPPCQIPLFTHKKILIENNLEIRDLNATQFVIFV